MTDEPAILGGPAACATTAPQRLGAGRSDDLGTGHDGR
jgi:hypothetical protein